MHETYPLTDSNCADLTTVLVIRRATWFKVNTANLKFELFFKSNPFATVLRSGRLVWVFISFLSLLTASCTSALVQQEPSDTPTKTVAESLELPNVELTSSTLSRLIAAELAYYRADVDYSIETLAKIAEETKDPRIAEITTLRAISSKRFDIATRTAALWIEIAPTQQLAWWANAVVNISSRQLDAAVDSFVSMYNLGDADEKNLLISEIARAVRSQMAPQPAYDIFREFVNRVPNNAYGYLELAHFAVASSAQLEVVEQHVDRAYELDSSSQQAAATRFSLYIEQNRIEDAEEFAKQHLKRNPDASEFRFRYAEYLTTVGNISESIEQYKKSDSDAANYRIGLIYVRANNLNSARKHFEMYRKTTPQNQAVLVNLAEVSMELGDYDNARNWIDQITERSLSFERAVLEARHATGTTGVNDGIMILNGFQAQTPDQRIGVFLSMHNLYRDVGELPESLSVLDVALQEFPENLRLLMARGHIASELELVDIAERDLKLVLSKEPDNASALNALGYTLADLTDRYEEAKILIEKALNFRPHDPYILDSMGWVEYKLGNFEQAIHFLRRAYQQRNDPIIAAHLGEVYWEYGRKHSARKVWSKALKVSPDDHSLKTTIEKYVN